MQRGRDRTGHSRPAHRRQRVHTSHQQAEPGGPTTAELHALQQELARVKQQLAEEQQQRRSKEQELKRQLSEQKRQLKEARAAADTAAALYKQQEQQQRSKERELGRQLSEQKRQLKEAQADADTAAALYKQQQKVLDATEQSLEATKDLLSLAEADVAKAATQKDALRKSKQKQVAREKFLDQFSADLNAKGGELRRWERQLAQQQRLLEQQLNSEDEAAAEAGLANRLDD